MRMLTLIFMFWLTACDHHGIDCAPLPIFINPGIYNSQSLDSTSLTSAFPLAQMSTEGAVLTYDLNAALVTIEYQFNNSDIVEVWNVDSSIIFSQ